MFSANLPEAAREKLTQAAATSLPAGVPRLAWLDELRGVAALAVLLGHYRVLLSDWTWTFPMMDIFARGVQLFYVLSGYVLYKLYSQKLEMPGQTRKFFIKRFFRIAPLYYLVTLLAFAMFYSRVADPWNNLISHLVILGSGFSPAWINGIIGVEWSIFVEFSFYLFFPLLLPLFRRRKIVILLLALTLSVSQTLLVYLMFPDIDTRTYFYNLPTAQLCFFVIGMWVADLHEGSGGRDCKSYWALMALSLILLLPFVIKSFTVQLYLSFALLGLFVYGYPFLRTYL